MRAIIPNLTCGEYRWIIGPAMFLGGSIVFGCGWWWLWNCSGKWPADRRNLTLGLSLCAIGALLIFWGVGHLLTSADRRSEDIRALRLRIFPTAVLESCYHNQPIEFCLALKNGAFNVHWKSTKNITRSENLIDFPTDPCYTHDLRSGRLRCHSHEC